MHYRHGPIHYSICLYCHTKWDINISCFVSMDMWAPLTDYHMSSRLLAPHAPYYSEILIGVRLIKHYLPLQRVIKRSHHVNSISALPFPLPLSCTICPPPTPALHRYTTPPLSTLTHWFFFFSLINHLFWAWESRGDLHCYSWLRPGSHISKRERWSARSLVPAHTHLLKGQKQLTPHFPRWSTTRRKGLLRTPRYRDGNRPHSAQGCTAGS